PPSAISQPPSRTESPAAQQLAGRVRGHGRESGERAPEGLARRWRSGQQRNPLVLRERQQPDRRPALDRAEEPDELRVARLPDSLRYLVVVADETPDEVGAHGFSVPGRDDRLRSGVHREQEEA